MEFSKKTEIDYRAFTKKHDETLHVRDLVGSDEPEFRHALKSYADHYRALWNPMDVTDERPTPTRFLLDLSGSMRGRRILSVVLALQAEGDAMAAQGTPFEILGFTTSAWKGGESRKDWLAQGRQMNPGRLNDLRHIVIKDMSEEWDRNNVALILREGLLKENIDGEALEWALGRASEDPEQAALVMISDGAPIDDSTLSVNSANYLERHFDSVMENMRAEGTPFRRVIIQEKGPTRRQISDDRNISVENPGLMGIPVSDAVMTYGLQAALRKASAQLTAEFSQKASIGHDENAAPGL